MLQNHFFVLHALSAPVEITVLPLKQGKDEGWLI
jgi:hypothetical protein